MNLTMLLQYLKVHFQVNPDFIFQSVSAFINFCIRLLAFVTYVPKFSNKLEPSDIMVAIAHISNPSIIPITKTIMIIELIFLLILNFCIKNLIAGSTSNDITHAIKNGM